MKIFEKISIFQNFVDFCRNFRKISLTFLRNIHLVEFWKNHDFCGNFPKISVSLEFWKTITIFVEISILVKLFEKFPLSLKTSKKFDFLGNFRKISLLVEFRKKSIIFVKNYKKYRFKWKFSTNQICIDFCRNFLKNPDFRWNFRKISILV